MLGKISGKLITYNPNTGVIHKSGLQQWKSWYFMSTYLSKYIKGEYGNNKELIYWIEDENGQFIEGDTKESQIYLRLQKEKNEKNKKNENQLRNNLLPLSLPNPILEEKYNKNTVNVYSF